MFFALLAVALLAASSISPASAADMTFSCTPDPTPGTDDRASETINISATTTIQINNCSWAYTTGSVSPSMSGGYIASGQLFTITGAGSLNVYVPGSWGKTWTITSSIAVAPTNSAIPSISGTTRNGQTLSTSNGTWSNSPISFSYQWQRASTAGGTYSNISGATASTYILTTSDIGQYIKSSVTATNSAGSSTAVSSATTQIGKTLQASLSVALSATSGTYPYARLITFTPTGGSGSGATTFQVVAGGTAGMCNLSSDTATVLLTSTSSGTCLLQALKASDSNYDSAVSPTVTFTFNKASQVPITITSTNATYGSNLPMEISGGSTGGTPTYRLVSGSCTVSGTLLTPTNVGSCIVTANLAGDINYLPETSSATTISIARGISTASANLVVGNIQFRQSTELKVSASVVGRVTFKINGKNIPGCSRLLTIVDNPYSATCTYKPSVKGIIQFSATIVPTDSLINGTSVTSAPFNVSRRTTLR